MVDGAEEASVVDRFACLLDEHVWDRPPVYAPPYWSFGDPARTCRYCGRGMEYDGDEKRAHATGAVFSDDEGSLWRATPGGWGWTLLRR